MQNVKLGCKPVQKSSEFRSAFFTLGGRINVNLASRFISFVAPFYIGCKRIMSLDLHFSDFSIAGGGGSKLTLTQPPDLYPFVAPLDIRCKMTAKKLRI